MHNQIEDTLELEITSKCVLQCPACARTNETSSDEKSQWDHGHLEKELLFDICDNTNFKRYLFVGCYGDPIYHPDFLEICEYFLSKGKKISIHTNGSAKPEKFWQQASQINWTGCIFTFSVDGLEDTNHLYRINAKWNQVFTGMNYMANIPKDRKPNLQWKFLVFPYNEHQIDKARELAMSIGFNKFSPEESIRNPGAYNTDNVNLYV